MVRGYGLAFVTASILVLGAPSVSRVRAQEDPRESMTIELKDGKVHVKITTPDGERVDRVLDADEFFHRILRNGDGDEDSVLKDMEKTLKSLPKKIEDALDDVKREADPDKAREKARELEKRVRSSLDDLMERLDPGSRTKKVRVWVGDKEMRVPETRGKARLY